MCQFSQERTVLNMMTVLLDVVDPEKKKLDDGGEVEREDIWHDEDGDDGDDDGMACQQ